MKLKLVNKTRFRDEDLRAIMRAACTAAGVAAREVIFRVNPGALHIRGRATLPSSRSNLFRGVCTMSIPRFEIWGPGRHGQRERTREQLVLEVCQVALHEAMHMAGAKHIDMTEEQYYCRMPVPWASGMVLREREEEPVVPVEERRAAARADRVEHARSMLRKAETRSKRANTILKKWKRRVATLEKNST